MERHSKTAIYAASVLAVGIGMMTHEIAHVLAGWIAGGSPSLITATEVRGDFTSLSSAGYVALGASGSLINVLYCALGWWGLKLKSTSVEFRLSAWFFFTVNGMLVATKMMAEPLMGIGDWMTIMKPVGSPMPLRILVAALGTVGVIFMVRRSGRELATLIPSGDPKRRAAEGRHVVLLGAVASIVLVLGGALASPVGTSRGLLLALGAGLGPFIPMLFGARFVARTPDYHTGPMAGGRLPWISAASVTTIVMWFVLGPGVDLSNLLP